jgi:hypothetical protein
MDSAGKAAVLFCLLALAAAGCGGDDSEEDTGAGQPQETSASGGGGGTAPGGVAKPGTQLGIGETARVGDRPLTAPVNSKKTYTVDATVSKIEKGDIGDFKNVNLDPDQKSSTPYYVRVKLSNPGETIPVKPSDDPDAHFDAFDDRGQEQSSLIIIGTFDKCEDKDAPKPFSKGKSYESCTIYLVPGGGSIREVRWTGTFDYSSKPVVWK